MCIRRFLRCRGRLSPETVGLIGVLYGLGSIAGGFVFGALSEKWGRKRAIVAASLLSIPVIPLCAYGHSALMLGVGAVLMQFMVQGAWGVVPAYLTELSPAPVRATAPGLAYQLGGLITSWNGKGAGAGGRTVGNVSAGAGGHGGGGGAGAGGAGGGGPRGKGQGHDRGVKGAGSKGLKEWASGVELAHFF